MINVITKYKGQNQPSCAHFKVLFFLGFFAFVSANSHRKFITITFAAISIDFIIKSLMEMILSYHCHQYRVLIFNQRAR